MSDREAGARLREAREAAGLTVTELADQVGCSRQTVYLLEAGQRPMPRTARALAWVLGLDVAEVWRGEE